MLFLTIMIAYCGYNIFGICAQRKIAEMAVKDITDKVVKPAEIDKNIVNNHCSEGGETTSKIDETKTKNAPISIDFDELWKVNDDIIGWIYCENTVINYPLLQGNDNQFYTDYLYNNEYNKCGSIFVDYRCQFAVDSNTIIYGHNMKNGSMFSCLVKYKSQEYYDEHTTMYVLTPTNNYIVEIFSGYLTKANSESYNIRFVTEEEFGDYIILANEKSDFNSNLIVSNDDKIVTLSTCSYEFDDARYVLHGVVHEIEKR